MFMGCRKLNKIPDGLFDPLINLTDVSCLFHTCFKLTSFPKRVFSNCKHIRKVDYMLYGSKVEKLPDDLFDGLDELESAEWAFYWTSLTKIPEGLFANKRKLTNLKGCFCSSDHIECIPNGLFDDCINLQNITKLFAYAGVFGSVRDHNTSSDLFSKCPNITETDYVFDDTRLSK